MPGVMTPTPGPSRPEVDTILPVKEGRRELGLEPEALPRPLPAAALLASSAAAGSGLGSASGSKPSSRRPSFTGSMVSTSGRDGPGVGVMTPGMVAAVRSVYAAACPVVLEALTAHYPSAAEVSAARAGGSAAAAVPGSASQLQLQQSLWPTYCSLLDVGLMLVMDSGHRMARAVASREAAGQLGAAASGLCACLKGMQRLMAQEYLAGELVSVGVVQGVLHAVLAVLHGALVPLAWSTARGKSGVAPHLGAALAAVSDLLKEVAAGLPAHYLDGSCARSTSANGQHRPSATQQPDSVAAAAAVGGTFVDCLLCAASITTPFTGTPGEVASMQPVPLPVPAATQSVVDGALVGLLVAGQSLMRKAGVGALPALMPAMLQLSTRLLATAPAGVQLQAAQRFYDACLAGTAAAAERLSSHAAASSSGGSAGGSKSSPSRPPNPTSPFSPAGQQATAGVALARAAVASVLLAADGLRASVSALEESQGAGAESALVRSSAYVTVLSACGTHLDTLASGPVAKQCATKQGAATGDDLAVGIAATRARRHVLITLAWLLERESPGSVPARARAAEAVRALLQEGAAENPPAHKAAWAQQLLAAMGPSAAAEMHALMSGHGKKDGAASASSSGGDLSDSETAVVAECIKLLIAGATLASVRLGEAGATAVVGVLVPLVVQAAAPADSARSSAVLRKLALQLITQLPTSAALGGPFKTAVAALPAALKLRLQAALRENAAGPAGGVAGVGGLAPPPAAGGQSGARPAIQLKTTFAIPPPS
mmetsp:Transcript_33762/g.85454  ORF Transcript_33762/g.85454 Transcript_33762/m.85454 type:complete len:773 (-) Transcript_33762:70-2388(-)